MCGILKIRKQKSVIKPFYFINKFDLPLQFQKKKPITIFTE